MLRSCRKRRCCDFELLEHRYLLSAGDPYNVPANPRITQDLDPAWKFALNPTGSPQSVGYDDSSWAAVDLPYTWDGSTTNAPTGMGWYRKTIPVDASLIGKELYLEFGGAYQVTSLYIDGTQVDYDPSTTGTIDSHNGGFGGFDFDVTSQLIAGNHLIAISVNNNTSANISPAGAGDYTKQGGLYRDVSLVAISIASHIAQEESAGHMNVTPDTPTPVATPGVYFTNSPVTLGIASATIQVQSILDNLSASSSSVNVTSYLVDANSIIQAQASTGQTLSAGQKSMPITESGTVANPHLWNGRIDPYLYTLYVEVRDSTTNALIDFSQQQVGIRSFKINASPNPSDPNPANQDQAAFELDGQPYQLVGVNLHQDSGLPGQRGAPEGWAQTAADIQQQVDLVMQLGGTFVRTAHYEYSQEFYDDADKAGLILLVDGNLQGTITSTSLTSAFVENYEDQLTENVKQNFNHPSIIAYSMYNEIGNSSANATLINNLNTFVHSLDPTRYTSADTDDGNNNPAVNSIDTVTDLLGEHLYGGWYVSGLTSDGSFLDTLHNNKPTLPIAVNEYGAGASANQYTTNILLPPPNTTSRFHPENAQSQLEELAYAQFASRNYLWSVALWNMTDFSITTRHEGDTLGQNDKGLITRDRLTYKDSYYFYQANWNDPLRSWANTPVLYISDHMWTDRTTSSATMTVYSNVGAPTLWQNGVQIGTMVPLALSGIAIPDTYTMSSTLTLAAGANNIQVQAVYNNRTYTNSVVWYYHAPALVGMPFARVDFTDTTADLQSGFVADTGQAFNGTYGWVDSTSFSPAANTAGTYNRTSIISPPFDQIDARTGIQLPTNEAWEYGLPNGMYDVHVVAADSNNTSTSPNNIVNNVSVNGNLLHDIDSTSAYGDNGFDEFYTTVMVTNGFLRVSAGAGSTNPVLAYIDINAVTPPSVISSHFQYAGPEQLQVQFSENVGASITASDLTLVNQTTGQTIATSSISVSYDSFSNTATFTFPSFAGGMLPVGNYQATIAASNVADANGLPLAADFTMSISQLVGDWNFDGHVDVTDIGAMEMALANLDAFRSSHSLSDAQLVVLGNVDGSDGRVTNLDVQALLNLLANGGGSVSQSASIDGASQTTIAIASAVAESAPTTPAAISSAITRASFDMGAPLLPLINDIEVAMTDTSMADANPGAKNTSVIALALDFPSVPSRLSDLLAITDNPSVDPNASQPRPDLLSEFKRPQQAQLQTFRYDWASNADWTASHRRLSDDLIWDEAFDEAMVYLHADRPLFSVTLLALVTVC
jgi:beta-galactosidase